MGAVEITIHRKHSKMKTKKARKMECTKKHVFGMFQKTSILEDPGSAAAGTAAAAARYPAHCNYNVQLAPPPAFAFKRFSMYHLIQFKLN